MCFFVTFILGFQLMAEERGLLVDVDGFNKAIDEMKERSRSAQNKVFQLPFFLFDVQITSDYGQLLDLHLSIN